MIEKDKEQFLSCLVGAAEIIGRDLSPQAIKLYWEILKKYDIEDVVKGFMSHASNPDTGQFMPKPADIIKAIDGGGESRAMQAWTKVEKAVRLVGPYESVVFDDPVIHQVISDMGGWIGFGSIQDKEVPFKANEFNKRYMGYSTRTDLPYPRKLIGSSEVHNEAESQRIAPPIFIGDQKKAQLVLENGGKDTLKISRGIELPKLTVNNE